jgi:hypothetical protein
VRDAGGHLADGGKPLAEPRVAFELLDVGDILKRKQQSAIAARCPELSGRKSKIDLSSVSGAIGRFDPAPPSRNKPGAQIGPHIGRQLEHIFDPSPDG